MTPPARTALVLGGGGARAAYQIGVLQTVAECLPAAAPNPFALISAGSAGALNGALLACGPTDFRAAVDRLAAFWLECPETWWPLRRQSFWRRHLAGGDAAPVVDPTPLGRLLSTQLDFSQLEMAIAERRLRALSIQCFGHLSAQTVSFFQGRADLEPWQDGACVGAHIRLGVPHVMAALSLPLVFPPVPLHREHFSDAVLGTTSSTQAAMHLGAARVLSIRTEAFLPLPERQVPSLTPTDRAMQGHVLGALCQAASARENVETPGVSISPSMDLSLLVPPGETQGLGEARWASYVCLAPAYLRALIELGRQDAQKQADELNAFLAHP